MAKSIESFLRLIREQQSFRKELTRTVPMLIDKTYSYFSYPDAQEAKTYLIEWYNNEENYKKIEPLLSKWQVATSPTTVGEATEQLTTTIKPQPNNSNGASQDGANMAGGIINIDRSESAYKELINRSIKENWKFRGFTLVPDIKDNKAIWSLFFY